MSDRIVPRQAEAISAAALPEEDAVEVLVVVEREPQAFLIGPVAARTLIVLLQEAVRDIERGA